MNWHETTLGACVDLISGPAFKSKFFSDDPSDIPLIKGENIGQGEILWAQSKYWPGQQAVEFERFKVKPGDVILAMDRPWVTAGLKYAWIKEGDPEALLVQRVARMRGTNGMRTDFLRYVVASKGFCEYIKAIMGGTNVPHISGDQIRGFKLCVPDPDTQDRIVERLAAYDDLIANNRRRIELLEQSARLLFKEWFVHLRYPGHEHDKIVDLVPTLWSTSTIEGVCKEFIDGDWLETKDQGGDSFRILQISNIGDNCFVETGNSRHITEETFRRLNCSEVAPGDIVISRMPEPIGRAWLVTPQPWRMVTAVDVTIARPDPVKIEPLYFLHHLNSSGHLARCAAAATGATRPRVAKRVMGALPVLLPPAALQAEFAAFAQTNNELKERLTRQCEGLAKARDLLLPRLMDGRISV